MKYIKLFEAFDLDKFLDDPNSQMGNPDSPEIEIGDWTKSYRGIGQVYDIEEDFYVTPDYFETELKTLYGSGFSIQPKFSQSAYFRFHNESEIYKGLYFVGAGTHPGAGIPGVLSSAKILDKIVPKVE